MMTSANFLAYHQTQICKVHMQIRSSVLKRCLFEMWFVLVTTASLQDAKIKQLAKELDDLQRKACHCRFNPGMDCSLRSVVPSQDPHPCFPCTVVLVPEILTCANYTSEQKKLEKNKEYVLSCLRFSFTAPASISLRSMPRPSFEKAPRQSRPLR